MITNPHQEKNKIDDDALTKIEALPEIKAFVLKAKKQQPELLIADKPNSKNKYYWIKVGLGDMGIFRTMYNFYVDPKTNTIYYLDFMVNKGSALLTLTEWRRWRTNSGFNKMHYYKAGKLVVSKEQ